MAIRDYDKMYPYQPSLMAKPVMFGYQLMPVIDTSCPALYGCLITMNGFAVAQTPNGTREECEILGFNAMQVVAHQYPG